MATQEVLILHEIKEDVVSTLDRPLTGLTMNLEPLSITPA
jgi:hypothetical protein